RPDCFPRRRSPPPARNHSDVRATHRLRRLRRAGRLETSMSSEPAASQNEPPAEAAKPVRKDRKDQVTTQLQAMMRDVPVSERLLRVLDDLEASEAAPEPQNQTPPEAAP